MKPNDYFFSANKKDHGSYKPVLVVVVLLSSALLP